MNSSPSDEFLKEIEAIVHQHFQMWLFYLFVPLLKTYLKMFSLPLKSILKNLELFELESFVYINPINDFSSFLYIRHAFIMILDIIACSHISNPRIGMQSEFVMSGLNSRLSYFCIIVIAEFLGLWKVTLTKYL